MAMVEDIKTRLEAQGIAGAGTNWEVKFEAMPDSPDKVVVLRETPGLIPDNFGNTDKPELQVRVRGETDDPQPVYNKIRAIYTDLQSLAGVINGVDYGGLWALQQPSFLRIDNNRRFEYVVNFQVLRERV